jgi:curved DNA-binding protein CbpA
MRKDINEYYRALGIAPGAEPAQIRRAYRQLVQQWHPDLFKPGSPMQTTAEDITKEINEAYEQLYRKGLHKKFRPVTAAPVRATEASDSGRKDSQGPESEPVRQQTRPPRTAKANARKPKDRAPRKDPNPKPARSRRFPPGFWAKAALAAAAIFAAFAASPRIWKAWMALPAPTTVSVETDSAGTHPSSRAANSVNLPSPHPGVRAATPEPNSTSWQIQPVDLGPLPDNIVPNNAAQFAVFSRSDPATLFKRAEALLDVFDVGDSKARVREVQGPPDDAAESVFRYGSSLVYFKNGVVRSWSNGLPRLRIHLWPSLDLSLLDRFSLGSSRDEVIRAQGDPMAFTPLGYYYGTSAVYFDNDRVSGWSRGDVDLRELDMPVLPFFELDSAGPR